MAEGRRAKKVLEPTEVVCAKCDQPIKPGTELREAWPEVVGYAPPRGATGGANQVALRRYTGRMIHGHCGKLARSGHDAEQGLLL